MAATKATTDMANTATTDMATATATAHGNNGQTDNCQRTYSVVSAPTKKKKGSYLLVS
jgi:hypothetical protein